jgi:hypothetical protein
VQEWTIGSKLMSHDTEVPDPLLLAIGEFREELLVWIETELVRQREREQAENRVMEERPAAATGSPFGVSSSRLGASPGRPYLESGMDGREPRIRERVADGDSVVESARPSVAVTGLETDSEPRARLTNPRQRLDALARLLDHRLKRAQGAAATGSGPNTEVEDETP